MSSDHWLTMWYANVAMQMLCFLHGLRKAHTFSTLGYKNVQADT